MEINTLLVVEDSPLLQHMWRIYSRRREFRILQAANGLEALEMLDENRDVDLIVLDINMPVMNGFEFMGRYNQLSTGKKVPIIVTSTEGEEAKVVLALKSGARAYLKKPFTSEEFEGLVTMIH